MALLFPLRGSGFHELNRGAFKALGGYNKFDDTPRANGEPGQDGHLAG
ncbi:conserved uncharacterized protein [Stigmatella aurantiaca DW4/3-1]|uniref:Conserved uncharacterized protein n=1 Tax=Stigmatella aurantiaca (strain DW4/3-1) TaxID=378806 RepID=E3FWK3_STIAD|nr:conserved uncharacterized protein [Stigmatella aurantiaca DW4/3-1]